MPEIICRQCGKRFTAATRRARYCPDCKKQHRRDADRFRLGWTKDEIAAGQRKLVCISCGKEITDLRAGQGRYCPDCRRKRISASVQMSARRAADGQPPALIDGRTKGSTVPRLPDGRVTPLLLRPGGPFDFVGSCTAPDGSPLLRARCKACGRIIERAPGFFWSRTTVSCGCLRRTPRSDERKETLRAAFRRVRPRVCKKCRRIFFGAAHERYCPACKKRKPFLKVRTLRAERSDFFPPAPQRRPGEALDLTGHRFGRLVALRQDGNRGKKILWLCQCDCGAVVRVPADYLTSGHTRSCGCLREDLRRRDITGQTFGELTALYPTDKRAGRTVIWHFRCSCGQEIDRSLVSIDRGVQRGDHITCGSPAHTPAHFQDGTHLGLISSAVTYSTNSSGVRGVCFRKDSGKWLAYIYFQGKRHSLGLYATLEEAAAARKAAEEKFFAPVLEAHKK